LVIIKVIGAGSDKDINLNFIENFNEDISLDTMEGTNRVGFSIIKDTMGVIKDTMGVIMDNMGIIKDTMGIIKDTMGITKDNMGIEGIRSSNMDYSHFLKSLK
jgi:hypothetical protein